MTSPGIYYRHPQTFVKGEREALRLSRPLAVVGCLARERRVAALADATRLLDRDALVRIGVRVRVRVKVRVRVRVRVRGS